MYIKNKEMMRIEAQKIAKKLKNGDLIILQGDLGAGKTQLVQWIGEFLNVKDQVTSPTFSLVQTYEGDLGRIYHLDLYRFESSDEIEDLDYESYLYPEGAITFIEWADRIEEYLPNGAIYIDIKNLGGEERELDIWRS